MASLGIIVSSTRPNRIGEHVARWVGEHADGWDIDLIDLRTVALPHFDELAPPKSGAERTTDHARAWAERIGALDAAIIVTPQYNGSYPGSLKNAVDYLYAEWENLPTILVGYGWGEAADVLELLGRLMARFGTDVVSEIGLGLGQDLSPAGELDVRPEVELALVEALGTLREHADARIGATVA
ncbi:NADPH-dependent FMN reductase [Brachybacterium hainanense]|uniref:NADPH-dependent FMN reductase n=1 Tax=Brachybacterium hainanense TaxID=1541174 RepID=A0ABV6RC83_9MICO